LPVGAPAPPDGLDSAADSFGASSFSAEAPPEGLLLSSPAPLELPPLSGSSVASLPPDSLAGLSVVEVFVLAVEVDVVCAAAFSALVSLGGVMSGPLLGALSEALLPPPQATSVVLESSNARISSPARTFNDLPPAIRAVPCAVRRWGSR